MPQFMAEAHLLACLQHKNILKVVGVITTLPMMVMTEMMQNSNLKSFLRACRPTSQNRKEALDIKSLLRIGSLVVEACEFLEERRVVHRALMASNVLVGDDHRDIRLTGLDSLRGTSGEDYEYVKTSATKDQIDIRWLAPESFGDSRFTVKSDVWSFGVVLWEIMTYGRAPFGAFKASEVAAEVRSGKRLERSQGCPEELFECMSACWRETPEDRPSFAEVRGTINLLLLTDAAELRAKVAAATNIAPIADLRWEIPTNGMAIVGHEPHGVFGSVSVLHSVTLPRPSTMQVRALALSEKSAEGARALRDVFDVIRNLKHQHLTTLLGCSSATTFTLLFDRPALGTLASAVLTAESIANMRDRQRIVSHVALGVEYIHANSFVHGRISPHTVYVDEKYNAKILMYMVQQQQHSGNAMFAPRAAVEGLGRWLAPETLLGQPVTPASDVFSFGMVLWSLFDASGAAPHAAWTTDDALASHVKASGAMPALRLESSASAFIDIFNKCTRFTPGGRPGMASVASTLLDEIDGGSRWEVDREALTVIQKLGSGQFGDVHKMATSVFSDDAALDFVAVKTLKWSGAGEGIAETPGIEQEVAEIASYSAAEREFMDEIELMKRLRHPNLVMLLGVCTRDRPVNYFIRFRSFRPLFFCSCTLADRATALGGRRCDLPSSPRGVASQKSSET
jgi:serine/threonine protein kinase